MPYRQTEIYAQIEEYAATIRKPFAEVMEDIMTEWWDTTGSLLLRTVQRRRETSAKKLQTIHGASGKIASITESDRFAAVGPEYSTLFVQPESKVV